LFELGFSGLVDYQNLFHQILFQKRANTHIKTLDEVNPENLVILIILLQTMDYIDSTDKITFSGLID